MTHHDNNGLWITRGGSLALDVFLHPACLRDRWMCLKVSTILVATKPLSGSLLALQRLQCLLLAAFSCPCTVSICDSQGSNSMKKWPTVTLAKIMTPHSATFCHKHVVASYQDSSKHDHKQLSPWHPMRPKASLPSVRCEIPLQCCKICVNPQLVICCPRQCPRLDGRSWLFLLEDGHTKRSGELTIFFWLNKLCRYEICWTTTSNHKYIMI